MITSEEAFKLIQFQFRTNSKALWKKEMIPVHESVGRILAQDIIAEADYPSFHRVAMDGIAINTTGLTNPTDIHFEIEGIQRAGSDQLELTNLNNAIEVMTGAPLPKGCDCVIRYEHVRIVDNIASLTNLEDCQKNKNIHPRASDYREGDRLLLAGRRINAPMVGVIVSQGLSQVLVFSLPSIAIISTGDELVDFDMKPLPHQLRKSNPYAIQSELISYGAKNIEMFHLLDDPTQMKKQLQNILETFSIVILSGGVSRGKFDYVPMVLHDCHVETLFHKIAQKPGKPLWFGRGTKGQMVFGLPGNPVSALICLRKYFITNYLEEVIGRKQEQKVKLASKIVFRKEMTFFVPVKIKTTDDGALLAYTISNNGSGDFSSLALSDGFIQLPSEQSLFNEGECFSYFSWSSYVD